MKAHEEGIVVLTDARAPGRAVLLYQPWGNWGYVPLVPAPAIVAPAPARPLTAESVIASAAVVKLWDGEELTDAEVTALFNTYGVAWPETATAADTDTGADGA